VKAAMYRGPQDLRVENVDSPAITAQEAKIRVHACATCGTDAKIFHHGHPRLEPPQIIGHEIAGEVIDVGSEVEGLLPGDRVQVIAAVPCGECWACQAGRHGICINQTSMGYQYPGGFAEEMVIPHEVLRVDGVNHIPDHVSYDEAAVTEPLAVR
jgi:Zn-dependent alcohol dehydrogenases